MNPSSPRNTRPMIQRRSLRHQSVPSQEEKHEQMTSTTLIESSTSLYPYVDFTSIVHPPREFRDEFGLSSQGIAEYSSANENIGPGGAASSMALGQISQSDFVARDGHLRQRAIALQYPYPGVLPTTEQYQQYQAQQEQSSPKRQRTRQRHQTSHEHQQQHYDQHAHRLPDRSPPSKVSRYEFDTVDKHQTSHGASSLVGREGMPQPAEPPKGPKPKFTPEDDQLLVDLKEKNNLTWKQIADFFPGRSSGTLQVRYCTKLKAKAIEWTEETLQRLQHAMQEYESDRWRIISTKVGHGFSAAACKTKAAELRPDLYEVEPEQGVGFVAEEEEQEELGVEEEVEGDDEEVEADESEVEEYS